MPKPRGVFSAAAAKRCGNFSNQQQSSKSVQLCLSAAVAGCINHLLYIVCGRCNSEASKRLHARTLVAISVAAELNATLSTSTTYIAERQCATASFGAPGRQRKSMRMACSGAGAQTKPEREAQMYKTHLQQRRGLAASRGECAYAKVKRIERTLATRTFSE